MPVQGPASSGGCSVDREQSSVPGGAVTTEPEVDTAECDHPHPRRGQFAVEAAGFAQMKVAMQLGDPGSQWQRTTASVDRQLADRLCEHRIDEDGEPLRFAQ